MYEVLRIDEGLRKLIVQGGDAEDLRSYRRGQLVATTWRHLESTKPAINEPTSWTGSSPADMSTPLDNPQPRAARQSCTFWRSPNGRPVPSAAAARRATLSLQSHFRPEFLNRVDEIVVFKPLTLAEIERIVDLQLEELRERLADMRITLAVTAEARRVIADQGFDPAYGARPLRRYISRELETRVGPALLRGDATDGGTISVDVVDGEITVTAAGSPSESRALA